jgi:hypothetical protein
MLPPLKEIRCFGASLMMLALIYEGNHFVGS